MNEKIKIGYGSIRNVVILSLLPSVGAALSQGSTIYIYPSENIQTVVNANAAGTTYEITAGVYRLQSVTPKAGDSYIGQTGAILNGSKLATSFSQQTVNGVTYWVTAGPTQHGSVIGECDSTHPMCAYPEDFFVNNQVLQRVASLSGVTSSTCYFDYSAGKIYFLMNPSGKTVEIGITPTAFSASVSNVTIKGLTIQKYAVPAQSGAVYAGTSWTIFSNAVSFNHGAGIHMTSNDVIESNYVHDNGQEGISGGGNQILVQNNEVAYNNTAGYSLSFEAGGVWFSNSTNPVAQGNYVHDNKGIGVHLDHQTYNWLVQGNRTQGNWSAGIDNEIGYDGTARYNVVQSNGTYPGKTNPSMWYGCGIYVYASQNTTIYGNTLLNNTNGICGISLSRGNGNRGAFEVRNLSVHDNVIVQSSGSATGAVANSGYYTGVYSSSWNNHWASNTYKLPSANADSYVWRGGSSYVNMDASSWQGFGNDLNGTWISSTDSSFPSNAFTANEAVQTTTTTQVWSLPTTTSTLVKTEGSGTDGTVTQVAGPIFTNSAWWWNVKFADGTVGWCQESKLQTN
ncbi:MAG: right-handed parallel beta-helix repeat-containing protein [Bryobacteraceae bacterium]